MIKIQIILLFCLKFDLNSFIISVTRYYVMMCDTPPAVQEELNMNVIDQEIIDEFIIEANELLGNAEEDILAIEETSEKETINRIFRAFHTVKGNASMIGLEEISTLAHHAEDTLTKVRSGVLTPNKKMIDLLLKVVDTLKQLLVDARSGSLTDTDLMALILELENVNIAKVEIEEKTTECTPPEPDPEPEPAPEPSESKPLKILVTEDDFTSRKIIKLMLSRFGQVDIAVNGEEAIEAVTLSFDGEKPEPYDLICMDIMMPEVDGMEATKRIRKIEKEKGIPLNNEAVIIMTTALNDPKTVIKSLYKCGATSYLVKPVQKQSLENELRKQGLIEE